MSYRSTYPNVNRMTGRRNISFWFYVERIGLNKRRVQIRHINKISTIYYTVLCSESIVKII